MTIAEAPHRTGVSEYQRLMDMIKNDRGEHRIVMLDRNTGERTVVGSSATAAEAFSQLSSLREEAHVQFLKQVRLYPEIYQPNKAYYAYTPEGVSITPSFFES